MLLCLGEPLVRFLFLFVVSLFADVFDFVVVSSFDFQAALPCYRHSDLASQAHEGLHQL